MTFANPQVPEIADDLVDYEEDEVNITPLATGKPASMVGVDDAKKEAKKTSYVGIHSTGFRDFLLKPELLRAISDCGFEHPSEVQQECIPQAILGMDVLCQARSGMGKTAVFVLATLQQMDVIVDGQVSVLVMCHTRELAFQIRNEYARFSKYMPAIRTAVFYGGTLLKENVETLKNNPPHVVVATPGRILALLREKALSLSKLKHFVLDECDKMMQNMDMRGDIQEIFKQTPREKQVMMFSATMDDAMRITCKKFMQNPLEVYIDTEAKMARHGLSQYFVTLTEQQKNRRLTDLLDQLEFNQVVIFVKSVSRANELNKLLNQCNFPSICIHSGMKQEERISMYTQFKDFKKRIMVATDLFGRGIDIERINIVINYDMPESADAYLHRVGRAGRFGTKGLAVTFVTDLPAETTKDGKTLLSDREVLRQVQERLEDAIAPLPDTIDVSTYMTA